MVAFHTDLDNDENNNNDQYFDDPNNNGEDTSDEDTSDEDTSDEECVDDNGTDTGNDDSGGATASSGDGESEASTPGAVARSGGDPDEQAPVTEEQGDVVDEVDTEGQLPATAGRLWVYVLPALGCLLLSVALVKRIRSNV